jgi:hypothetical protein
MSDGSLQFEKAEFAEAPAAAATCGFCREPLRGTYYGVDGKPACPRCKDEAAARGTQGSGFGRFVRATLFGTIAGGLGAGLWYAVRAVTSLEIGLISILVGLAVGVAVRAGSYGRGGPLYQALAVFITYTAIVSTYVPLIVTGLREQWTAGQAGQSAEGGGAPSPGSSAAPESAPVSAAGAPADEAPSAPVSMASAPAEETPADLVSPGQAIVALGILSVLVVALAYVAPFLGGFENIIGLAIIAFGMWEAWKINRRVAPEISGPWNVASPASSPVPPPIPAGE